MHNENNSIEVRAIFDGTLDIEKAFASLIAHKTQENDTDPETLHVVPNRKKCYNKSTKVINHLPSGCAGD